MIRETAASLLALLATAIGTVGITLGATDSSVASYLLALALCLGFASLTIGE